MKRELVYVTLDGRLVIVWFYSKTKAARQAAWNIFEGLEVGGAEYLGEL